MQGHRGEKISSIIKKLSADFVERASNKNSLITITDVKLSDDLSKATILFTVIPERYELAVSDFLKRQRSDLREFVKGKWKMHTLPFFDFELDKGEKNRQRIDELLNQAKQ